ncbi:MAG: bifunctional 4-hydroxy-2-oxoglutarate aldolase/2-dehydro-3-deoxy-phosphogluconate aldolase [Acidimicrobiaceae bacterium]|nr:bifunctional 4-hydroxy-2-oxoglutarate aldolase/2-dehydro-3-deoxy-phosphogluconate aldolase [Acidimicrobiaceae bacterium]
MEAALMTFLQTLAEVRVVPVVVLNDPPAAKPLAEALIAGGLPLAEVTFRTEAAEQSVRAMAAYPALTVGAGTVTSADQVDTAVAAGAKFVVSPGFSAAVISRCRELDVAVVPGVATATELMAALDAGITTVKLFPAEPLGGVSTLRALAAAFPQIKFVPTGGISTANATSYLAEPSVLAVGGSWMVAPALLAQHSWDNVTRLASEAVHLVREAGQAG